MTTLDTSFPSLFLLLLVLAMVHALFQLGISVLTLMSTHVLGRTTKTRIGIRPLIATYVVTSIILTAGIMGFVLYSELLFIPLHTQTTVWFLLSLIIVAVGSLVLVRYHKPGKGTRLWIAAPIVEYFQNRSQRAKTPLHSAKLAANAIITELPLTLVIFVSSSLVLIELLPSALYGIGILVYSTIVMLPLAIFGTMIASGHHLSTIQRWREANKHFFQYTVAFGLFGAALYILVFLIGYGG